MPSEVRILSCPPYPLSEGVFLWAGEGSNRRFACSDREVVRFNTPQAQSAQIIAQRRSILAGSGPDHARSPLRHHRQVLSPQHYPLLPTISFPLEGGKSLWSGEGSNAVRLPLTAKRFKIIAKGAIRRDRSAAEINPLRLGARQYPLTLPRSPAIPSIEPPLLPPHRPN